MHLKLIYYLLISIKKHICKNQNHILAVYIKGGQKRTDLEKTATNKTEKLKTNTKTDGEFLI